MNLKEKWNDLRTKIRVNRANRWRASYRLHSLGTDRLPGVYSFSDIVQAVVSAVIKLGAAGIILSAAVADYFALKDMLETTDADNETALVLTTILVLALEGFPTAIGYIRTIRKDRYHPANQSGKGMALMNFISILALIGAFAIVFWMRYQSIQSLGGSQAFYRNRYAGSKSSNLTYLHHVLTMFSPILTSMLALVVSSVAFSSNGLKVRKRELEKTQRRLIRGKMNCECNQQKYQDRKTALWNSLTDAENTMIPSNYDDYVRKCQRLIRQKLIDNTISQYPGLLQAYTIEVESALSHYLVRLYDKTTCPDRIAELSIQDIIDEYNRQMADTPQNQWDLNGAGGYLADELQNILNQAYLRSAASASFDQSGSRVK